MGNDHLLRHLSRWLSRKKQFTEAASQKLAASGDKFNHQKGHA